MEDPQLYAATSVQERLTGRLQFINGALHQEVEVLTYEGTSLVKRRAKWRLVPSVVE